MGKFLSYALVEYWNEIGSGNCYENYFSFHMFLLKGVYFLYPLCISSFIIFNIFLKILLIVAIVR